MEEYKSILWLDDLNELNQENFTPLSDNECIQKRFGSLHDLIHLVKDYSAAIKAITSSVKYDLVVFDMDWQNANYATHKQEFKTHGIILPDDMNQKANNVNVPVQEYFVERAGAYLYHLLLLQGYPRSRMVIFTHNDTSIPKKVLNEAGFTAVNVCKKSEIDKFEEAQYFWDEFFQGDFFYYRIRRLVFQACDHWKNWLENEKDGKPQERNPAKIPFNHVYFCEEPENQISCESFKEMLDRVKMLFPVVQPSNTEQVYYQALQMAAMMHEESADIKKVKGFFQPWHSMIRNFRNWGAHNKFENASLDGEQFAFLFCIALRTFFDEKQINNLHEFSDFYEYETIFDFQNSYKEGEECTEIKADFTEETLEQALCKIWQELRELEWKNINSTANALNIDGELSNLIWKIPRNCKTKMESKKYLFVPVWCRKKETCGDEVSIKPNSSEFEISSDNKTLKNSVSYTYTWNYEKDTLQKICDKAKKDTPEAVFMRYCYRWLSQEEKS